jgi:hypothetical protein
MYYDVIIIGGGAAGFFTAINIKENNSSLSVAIFEQSKEVLNKVRISGGGRCNVTNSIWEPQELIKNYPRGQKELLGPFYKFSCADTISWFEYKGVPLKIEEDGRVFPISDNSASIIDCFLSLAYEYNIAVKEQSKMKSFSINEDGFEILINNIIFKSKYIVLATGSTPSIWEVLKSKGYGIIEPVPSLFTFNIKDGRLQNLMGISVPNAEVSIPELNINSFGPLLITHWGLSGPGILRLSSFAARELAKLQYKFTIKVDWLPHFSRYEFQKQKQLNGRKLIYTNPLENLPSRLWKSLFHITNIDTEAKWADLNKEQMEELIDAYKESRFIIKGKSTFKEEFVTAGGVDLKQINFKTFESKLHPNLYMAGEVLNIDAVTGGFNFQAAWTGAWLIAQDIASK